MKLTCKWKIYLIHFTPRQKLTMINQPSHTQSVQLFIKKFNTLKKSTQKIDEKIIPETFSPV